MEIDNPDDYRGITVNTCLCKLFNLYLSNRLGQFVNDQKILKYNQIGFRKGFSTADHALTLKTLIDVYFSKNKKNCLSFVDIKEAYDSRCREALVTKLLRCGFSRSFVPLLYSIYDRTKLSVKLPSGISEFVPSSIGPKQ